MKLKHTIIFLSETAPPQTSSSLGSFQAHCDQICNCMQVGFQERDKGGGERVRSSWDSASNIGRKNLLFQQNTQTHCRILQFLKNDQRHLLNKKAKQNKPSKCFSWINCVFTSINIHMTIVNVLWQHRLNLCHFGLNPNTILKTLQCGGHHP